jgi:hypothetical protein
LPTNPVSTVEELDRPGLVRVVDRDRVRTVTLDRADALNAFNEALYDAVTDTLLSSAEDPGVAVVLLTGTGRAFCAGTDLLEMAARTTDPGFKPGVHGFPGLIDALIAFPKPLIIAVNGLGLGIGTTILGFADLAFMSTTAKLKCPFTSLGVGRSRHKLDEGGGLAHAGRVDLLAKGRNDRRLGVDETRDRLGRQHRRVPVGLG